jgi:hypothetical protein
MKRIGLSILVAFTITSCGNKHDGEKKPGLLSNLVSITDNEDKGVKEILAYYSGECKYSIGAENGGKRYFELEMSKSQAIEKYAHIVEMPASNIAYLFYKNLKQEKSNYDEIHTVIILNNGDKKAFTFSPEKLEIVGKKMMLVNKVVELIKNKNFEAIKPMLNNTSLVKYDKNELVANLSKVDPTFGTVKKFLTYGFRFNKSDGGKEILHISGALIRDKQSHEFSVDLDLNSTKDEILILQYKL